MADLAEETPRHDWIKEQREGPSRDQRDLREDQRLESARPDLVHRDAPDPGAKRRQGLTMPETARAQGHRDDVVAEKSSDVAPGGAVAGRFGQYEQARDREEWHGPRACPEPARADEHVEAKEERRRLGVVRFLEIRFEVEPDGRQAHEAEHKRRAHGAFEPVERVGLELLRDDWESGEYEARYHRGAMGQDILSRLV